MTMTETELQRLSDALDRRWRRNRLHSALNIGFSIFNLAFALQQAARAAGWLG